MTYLKHVDGLRAVAVISVILYHLKNTFVPNGFLGVDIFFVISGFIISATVAKHAPQTWLELIGGFYERRLRRIFPALVLCLVTTGLLSALFIPDAWLSETIGKTGAYAFFGLSNIILERGTDYFSAITEYNPYTHTWSLGVEEQFYVLFPFVFAPWVFASSRFKIASPISFVILFAISLGIWLALYESKPLTAFYAVYTRLWQLAAGAITFQILSMARTEPGATARSVLATIGLLLIVSALFIVLPMQQRYVSNILAVAGACVTLIALGGAARAWPHLAALSSSPATFIGRMSYSLYLWHWPIFVLMRWTVGLEDVWHFAIALVLTFTISWLSYRYVENFFRYRRIGPYPRVAAVSICLALVIAGYATFAKVNARKNDISLAATARHLPDWDFSAPLAARADRPGCEIKMGVTTVNQTVFNTIKREGCTNPVPDHRRIFLIGDSHAVGYWPMIKMLAMETGMVAMDAAAGCLFILPVGYDQPNCNTKNAAIWAAVLQSIRPGDIVFLASMRLPYLATQWTAHDEPAVITAFESEEYARVRQQNIAAAKTTLAAATALGARVIIEETTPMFRSPSFRCLDWFNKMNPVCRGGLDIERSVVERMRAPVLAAIAELKRDNPAIESWDPISTLCDARTCSAMIGERPVFKDGDHVSTLGNKMLYPDFARHVLAKD